MFLWLLGSTLFEARAIRQPLLKLRRLVLVFHFCPKTWRTPKPSKTFKNHNSERHLQCRDFVSSATLLPIFTRSLRRECRYQHMLRMPRAQTALGSIESFLQNGTSVRDLEDRSVGSQRLAIVSKHDVIVCPPTPPEECVMIL